MFLFIDFTFHPIIELVLPNAYIAEQRNGYCVFYKKASDEVLRSLPNWELSSAEKEALSIINSLQPNELYQKYLKKGDTFSKIYQNAQTKKHIQEQIEDKTDKLLTLICKNELFITTNYTHKDELVKKQVLTTTQVLEPILELKKTEEGIRYRLLLDDGEQTLLPCQSHIEFLNNHHAWIILNKKVVRIAHIKTSHLTPFLNKETTIIPERSFPEYFEKFLKKILRNAKVLP